MCYSVLVRSILYTMFFSVLRSVIPFLMLSNPIIALVGSVESIVNATELIIKITSSFTVALITILFTLVVSRTVAVTICETVAPIPWGPIRTYPDPLKAYNCSFAESHHKSPVANPAGAVVATSAPPVVLNLEPS